MLRHRRKGGHHPCKTDRAPPVPDIHITRDDVPTMKKPTNSKQTSRFKSWTSLCSGTEKRYPDTNDIFRSTHYSRRPRNFEQTPKARTNAECRICKLLDASGNHGGTLYVNHYGNFPIHCPQWAQMDIKEKRKFALEAGYCLRCFSPRIFVMTRTDLIQHRKDECYVKSTNKHKFTCLNKTCLQHSWICRDHTDENRPLLEAHHREAADNNQEIPLLGPVPHGLNRPHTPYQSPRLPPTGTPLSPQGE